MPTIIPLSEFSGLLRVNNYRLSLSENLQKSVSGAGVSHVRSLGPRLWQGELVLSTWDKAGQRKLQTLVQQIQDAGTYFIFSPNDYKEPALHNPILNIDNVTTDGVQVGGSFSLNVKGLPANYRLCAGDYISMAFGGIFRLYALKRDVTATATGTATLTLNIALPFTPLPANNTAVQLRQPRMTAVYVPETFSAGTVGIDYAEGCSFGFTQAIRTI